MALKAVLFNFNGVIVNDESIHQQLIADIILKENLRPSDSEYQEFCLGRSDRACLRDILSHRGRVVSEDYLTKLIKAKAEAYREQMETSDLPIYSEVKEFLSRVAAMGLAMGVVAGALKSEVERVLEREEIASFFSIIVAGDDVATSKPEPDGYLLAVERFNERYRNLRLQPADCLAIEDTLFGIKAAKCAGMQVVGVANTYPFHIMQRQANWAVDYLTELELERVKAVFSGDVALKQMLE